MRQWQINLLELFGKSWKDDVSGLNERNCLRLEIYKGKRKIVWWNIPALGMLSLWASHTHSIYSLCNTTQTSLDHLAEASLCFNTCTCVIRSTRHRCSGCGGTLWTFRSVARHTPHNSTFHFLDFLSANKGETSFVEDPIPPLHPSCASMWLGYEHIVGVRGVKSFVVVIMGSPSPE